MNLLFPQVRVLDSRCVMLAGRRVTNFNFVCNRSAPATNPPDATVSRHDPDGSAMYNGFRLQPSMRLQSHVGSLFSKGSYCGTVEVIVLYPSDIHGILI